MTDRSCPLCSENQANYIFTERGHDLLQCQACDLFFIHPYPEQTEVYETVSDYEYDDLEILDSQRHYESSCATHDILYPQLREEFVGAKNVLDVGCGTGRLLELLKEFDGLNRVGMELNRPRAAFAREKAECTILEIPVQNHTPETPYDVIALMNVLAHVPDCVGFLETIKKQLSPNGKAIIKVGEMESNVKKTAIFDWQIPDHLQLFGLRTIEYLVNKVGMKVVRHERTPLRDELFSKWRWMAPGRSSLRNFVKRMVARTPMALPILRSIYGLRHGDSVYSSLIVITRQ